MFTTRSEPSLTAQRTSAGTAPQSAWHRTHTVICPWCTQQFDLFAAPWCKHIKEPSKRCPHCERCMCEHSAYREPHFWKRAPLAFQRHGFERLFLLYL